MAAKDRETKDFSVIVDIFDNSLIITCGDGLSAQPQGLEST